MIWIVLRLARLFNIDCATKWWISAEVAFFPCSEDFNDAFLIHFEKTSRPISCLAGRHLAFIEAWRTIAPKRQTAHFMLYAIYYQYYALYSRVLTTLYAAHGALV